MTDVERGGLRFLPVVRSCVVNRFYDTCVHHEDIDGCVANPLRKVLNGRKTGQVDELQLCRITRFLSYDWKVMVSK